MQPTVNNKERLWTHPNSAERTSAWQRHMQERVSHANRTAKRNTTRENWQQEGDLFTGREDEKERDWWQLTAATSYKPKPTPQQQTGCFSWLAAATRAADKPQFSLRAASSIRAIVTSHCTTQMGHCLSYGLQWEILGWKKTVSKPQCNKNPRPYF